MKSEEHLVYASYFFIFLMFTSLAFSFYLNYRVDMAVIESGVCTTEFLDKF